MTGQELLLKYPGNRSFCHKTAAAFACAGDELQMLQVILRAAWEAHRAFVGLSLAAVRVAVNQVSVELTARHFSRSGTCN